MSDDVKENEDVKKEETEDTKAEAPKISFREKIPYQAILLGGFALAASTLLATGNESTQAAIAERLREDLLSSLEEVVPQKTHSNDLLEDIITLPRADGTEATIYRGQKNGQVTALAYGMVGQGYAGAISVIMGVDATGEILGVRVLSHAETPGLGDKIEVAKNNWITKFTGLSFDNLVPEKWKVKKDGGHFDQFSGATITPRAVVSAVTKGLNFYKDNKEKLLEVKK
ncbi:MAG: electron transport complex subunit RsxG [Methylocystaceae bacterium]|nr:electron transport complex subunit RsxG [Methylocystaceae bacterium]